MLENLVTPAYLKRKFPNNPAMHEVIDYINHTLYYLHQEYLNSGANPEGEYKWKKNIVDLNVKMVAALGHGHEMHGTLSTILGNFGNITRAYRETILGSYATDMVGNATLWVPDDRLWEVGKGPDKDHRAFALRQYKNGFLMLANALAISAFSSGGMLPVDGSIQYVNKRLQLYFDEVWHDLAFKSELHNPVTIHEDSADKAEIDENQVLRILISAGNDGVTPNIGENGNWWIGPTDTGVKAGGTKGDAGYTPQKGTDYFDGDDGYTPYIQGGYWYINGVNTGIPTTGANGKNPELSVQSDYICWRLVGDADWIQLVSLASLKGDAGRGITSIVLQSTVGLVKTYRITFTDDYTFDFSVTDGADGASGGGGGALDEIVEVYIDFVDSVPYTYTCPVALRFTSMEYEGNAPTLSVALNTEMAQYQDIVITPNGAGLVLLKGAIASTFSFDVYIDFAISGAETYKCPYPLKFTAMEHEQANAPTLSTALNTDMTKYQVLTVTADAPGLVTLKATIL